MSESLEIPSPLMEKIINLKIRPEETPIDGISRALEVLEDDDYIDESTAVEIEKGIEEYDSRIFTTEENMAKKIGL